MFISSRISRTKLWLVFLAIGLLAIYATRATYELFERIPNTPEEAISQFYFSDVAEDQIIDPRILAGSSVVPQLLEALPNKEMLRRRYAIGALGLVGDHAALPTLWAIVTDPSEQFYVQCDALEAIAQIDWDEARQRVKTEPLVEHACLDMLRRILLTNDTDLFYEEFSMRRSYLKALIGRHN